ncbi:glycosyltransferase [Pontibacter vulgaris]|uniref:glycosyltransferase n=1 Tax=Pontibacter vulgaris TaxID=2905679 RepID=UPI001FA6B04C|nr:glycosyltransferase [Pontibacter vulgaris]
MKIAYLLSWELGKQDGVTKKVYTQAEQWLKAGHEVRIFCISKSVFTPSDKVPTFIVIRKSSKNIFSEFSHISKAYKQIKAGLQDYSPDIIYHRSEIYQPELKQIMTSYPTVVEINTNDLTEFRELARKNLKGKIRYIYYNIIRDQYFSRAAGFCCVTNEIASLKSFTKYSKPIEVVPNALNPDKFRIENNSGTSSIPKLLFMGSPDQNWHGVDKILTLANATIGELQIEVIGPEKPKNISLPKNINFHGYLKQAAYEEVLKTCDIGICSLALHRNKMDEACPLKTREYLAYGLPIIIGYKDTAFYESKPEWVLQLENNEDNIKNNINRIVSFSKTYKNIRVEKKEISKYIDTQIFEKKRLDFLENIIHPVINS